MVRSMIKNRRCLLPTLKLPLAPCSSRPISSFFFIPSIVALLKLSPLMGLYAKTEFHVLAVDDSPIDRMLIERLLQTYSYQVTTVDSGLKALEFLRGENNHRDIKVNMVITDYCMPEMTGYDLLRRIKESKTMKDIPVVIMSSENNTSRISRCLEEGAEEFLLKPVKRPDVEKLISHLQTGKDRQNSEVRISREHK